MLTKKDNNPKSEPKNAKNEKNASLYGSHEAHHHDGCCKPSGAASQQPARASAESAKQNLSDSQKGSGKTQITVKYNAGFPNQLYIRGNGANLSWEKGLPLKNVKPDEWVWETDASFNKGEFKILINDHVYENGENHLLNPGAKLVHSPSFY